MTKETRSIEREVFIEADPERVWHALTDADEIVKWFALKAETQPGVGGFISLAWDLKAVEPDRCHILEWDPGKHLLMTWRDAPGGDNELPVEITLIRRQGGTLLRLVHSGFLSDASWDEEYESHGRGWSYELRSLKYYLERQFSRTRHYVLQRFPLHGDRGATWSDVVGPSGVFAVASDDLLEGAEFRLRLPTGATTFAELLYFHDGRDFVATARILQGGFFRIALEMISGEPEVWIWAFSWQLGQEDIRAIVQPAFDAVAERLAGRPRSQCNELH